MQEHRITEAATALQFMLAGNAYFTLRSSKTGTRYTYRVNRAKRDSDVFFVSVMYGSDNTGDYTYLGIVKDREYKQTAKSKVVPEDPRAKAFLWAFLHLTTRDHVPDQLEFWHEGRCGRCGRLLAVPESIENGIGPECAKRFAATLC